MCLSRTENRLHRRIPGLCFAQKKAVGLFLYNLGRRKMSCKMKLVCLEYFALRSRHVTGIPESGTPRLSLRKLVRKKENIVTFLS